MDLDRAQIIVAEDTSIGGVTWHASEDSGPPDVGISVTLGANDCLYAGEISRALWDECAGYHDFDTDGGWFLVRFAPDRTTLIAKFGDQHEAQSFIEDFVAPLARTATP